MCVYGCCTPPRKKGSYFSLPMTVVVTLFFICFYSAIPARAGLTWIPTVFSTLWTESVTPEPAPFERPAFRKMFRWTWNHTQSSPTGPTPGIIFRENRTHLDNFLFRSSKLFHDSYFFSSTTSFDFFFLFCSKATERCQRATFCAVRVATSGTLHRGQRVLVWGHRSRDHGRTKFCTIFDFSSFFFSSDDG